MPSPTQLTVSQLFTPAPSGVGPYGNVPQVPVSGTWLSIMLQIASTVQLPTTSWQSGAPERTILAIEAICFSQSDANISVMAQGAFLQSAASGSVTYTTNNGTTVTTPVTPDPSNPAQNPTGALGWLDLLGQNVYDVFRLQATFASGQLALANISISSVGPFAAGSYHVANVANNATYSNVNSLTIPSSIIAGSGGVVSGVQTGTSTIITTSHPHGLLVAQVVYVVVPTSSGVSGLNQVFAAVVAVTPTTFQVAVATSGTWTAGGQIYLCTLSEMTADKAGNASNAGPFQVTQAITQNANVFISNVSGWSGSNWESNTAYASRCQLSLAAASPNGPSQAYVYFADTAAQILAETTGYVLTNGPVIASESANPQTGIVTTVVASTTPNSTIYGENVTPGCSQLLITNVSNTNPAVITCAGPTTIAPAGQMTVIISGVAGVVAPNVNVNGTWTATYVSADSFSIDLNTTTASTYVNGGSIEGGDLGAVDALIQDNVVPDGIVGAQTVSALALPIVVVATVVVPKANVALYQLAVITQLQLQIASYDIGGNAPDFEVAYDDIVGALEEAGVVGVGSASYVRQIQSLSINGGGVGVGVPFPTNQFQAILVSPSITVLGV